MTEIKEKVFKVRYKCENCNEEWSEEYEKKRYIGN